ncbi:hypothetical protein RD792_013031 [Penstemon davidsonii]|uniref:NB-ARC domain-containing protein n=1 Tax=Penstemon davidsonii TaxID=160366 RepID=A0ABR0CSD9_9LAMI|nr:hypothetical protein RD792_013031 [Penstemon davidsonii]
MPQDNVNMDELNESLVQIRDVAYEAEYLVNSYVVGNLPLWHLNIRLPAVIPNITLIGTKLLEIKTISDIKVLKVMKDFSGEESSNAMKTSSAMVDNTIVPFVEERKKILGDLIEESNKFDNIVVGFEDERTKILGDLIGGSKNRQIISIFGMPGLGKTTLARMLYDDPAIYDHFDKRVWCVVSQTYQKRKVLIDILSLSSMSNILGKEDERLAVDIHKTLKGRKYLIVIDDVWSTNVWDDLGRFFPDDGNGSRIVFTSRIKGSTPTDSIFHPLPLLGEDKCWELLENKVFLKEPCPPQLIGIGKRIAAKCNGLPIAVVVTAGILLNSKKEENEWKIVEANLDSYILNDDTSNCMQILELSYKHLPNHLKLCFLYFGAFSEDTNIPLRKLIWLWIAEGFIMRDQEKDQEEVAEEYLLDLINRSLVIIAKRSFDGRVKACIIHDLLRDMCLGMAQEENFLKSIKDHLSIYERYHRLYVHSAKPVDQRPFGLHCRSFSGHVSQSLSSCSQMALLRVMDQLPTPRISYELKRIYLLVQLRYIVVDRMPKPLTRNLFNLEFLCINSNDKVYIPSVILKLVRLRHLYVKQEAEFEKDVDSSQTNNLRSLSFVRINNDNDEQILKCSPHLRKLKFKYTGRKLFPDLQSLTALESLKLVFDSDRVFSELTEINFPSTIKKLSFIRIGLSSEKISIVGRLPNLHVLKLFSVAFEGEEWETSDDEFQELRFLKLDMMDLKQWITCSEHFPQLQCLILHSCWNLEEIPIELGNITTLECIQVLSSGYEASLSAVRIEEEQRDQYGNEELKVIIANTWWSKEELVRDCREGISEED